MDPPKLALQTILIEVWFVFFLGTLRQTEKEHKQLIKGWNSQPGDISEWVLQRDAKERLYQILELLRREWRHWMPPYGLLKLSAGTLELDAAVSEHVRDKISGFSKEEPKYGYIIPPKLTSHGSLESYEDAYLALRSQIAYFPLWMKGNDDLDEIHFYEFIPQRFDHIIQHHFVGKTFAELEEAFPWFRFSFDPTSSVFEAPWYMARLYDGHPDSGWNASELLDLRLF
jgi:hypothetical protein